MATPDPLTLRSVEMFLARVRTRYAIAEAWLYGSRARGDFHNESDVDLALIFHGELPGPASSIAADIGGRETYDVLTETGRYVSPIPIAAAQWRDPSTHSNPFLLKNIRRDGIAV